MKTWIVSSLDEETIQGEETIWGNTVCVFFQTVIKTKWNYMVHLNFEKFMKIAIREIVDT